MPNYGPDVNDYNPSWMEDGGGLSGGSESDPNLDNYQSYLLRGTTVSAASWDTQTTSAQNQSPEDNRAGPGCDPGAPPSTGTWIFGVVGGECQWINTTECS